MRNKLLILLAFVLICTTSKVQAYSFSSVAPTGQTLYFNIVTSNTVEVTSKFSPYPFYNIQPTGVLTIPDSVTNNGITYSITSIGNCAFYNCSGLTSITIPNSVTSIGNSVFYGCNGLTYVIIPNSITSIGSGAFQYCSGLTSITIPNSVTSIGSYVFDGTPYYNNIPNGVVYINNVLYKYKGTIPAGTTINIPAGIISISDYAFYYCNGLTSITIPNSVTSIGSSAFSYCSGLTSITIPSSVTSIGNNVFTNCSGLTSITIPNSITSMGHNVFKNCSGLTSITIPNSITSIKDYTFSGCSGLTSITIPNSITSIKDYAFSGCSGLTSITIPNSITSIKDYAFSGCSGLTSITIPDSITMIGSNAFSGCSGLTSITCKALNPPLIGGNTFYNVSNTIPIYIPCGAMSKYQSDYYWNQVSNITEDYLIHHYDTICQRQTYTNYGFNFIADTTGIYIQNLQTINGCDSIITLNLIVNPISQTSYIDSICQGQVYNQFGFNFIADTSGVYTQNLQTINGCDSIITLNLTVNPIYSTAYNDIICQGQIYNQYGFNADSTGIYTQNLQTINGCDSIITLNLTVNPSPNTPSLLVERKHSYLEITWDSVGESYEVYRNDSLIATTSQGIYQDSNVLNDSSYCYKVKAFIGDCESDFSVEECMQFVGLNDININNHDITLYPNPTNGKAKLSIQSLNYKAQVIIFDLTGRVLKTYIIDTNQKELEIDLSGYAKGVYNISINNNNTNISKKLVIQ